MVRRLEKNMMNCIEQIVVWLKKYAVNANVEGFVVGVSGGIDSAVTSTLCAKTELPVLVLSMPIHQDSTLHSRSELQVEWLEKNFSNVTGKLVDLSKVYDNFAEVVKSNSLGLANSKARLRMTTLYAFATAHNSLVAGTGNKVEDFGVGFFTKYGDGGVDLSPIADLMKSEVYAVAKELGIPEEIQNAAPTDGLWGDSRTDEEQLEATYDELEWAMQYEGFSSLAPRQRKVLEIYNQHHQKNLHKMVPLPVCEIKR